MRYRKHKGEWIPINEFNRLQVDEEPKKESPTYEGMTRSTLYKLAQEAGLEPEWNGHSKQDFIDLLRGKHD